MCACAMHSILAARRASSRSSIRTDRTFNSTKQQTRIHTNNCSPANSRLGTIYTICFFVANLNYPHTVANNSKDARWSFRGVENWCTQWELSAKERERERERLRNSNNTRVLFCSFCVLRVNNCLWYVSLFSVSRSRSNYDSRTHTHISSNIWEENISKLLLYFKIIIIACWYPSIDCMKWS